MGEYVAAVDMLKREIFVKTNNVRIFNCEKSTLAVNLQTGKALLFTPFYRAIYMACNGLNNGAQIVGRLSLNWAHGGQLLEKLLSLGFIKVVGNTAHVVPNRGLVFPDSSSNNETPTIIFDASELEDDNFDEKLELWWRKGNFSLTNSAAVNCQSEYAKPIFYFKNINWTRHSEFLDNLLEQWQSRYTEKNTAEDADVENVAAPFYVIFDSDELPKGANFVNYCQGCASASRLCAWDRLSALGKLWCKLHVLNAEIIWRFPFEVLLQKEASAFSDCFKEEPIAAPRLSEAAEVAAMLLDTARKNFGIPEGHCGCFPISGIAILPVVRIDNIQQLEQIWQIFPQSNCSAFGFCLRDGLWEEKSADLQNSLLKGLELCFHNGRIDRTITIFPLTRWLQDLLGEIPRRENMQMVWRSQKQSWRRNKCRRCVNWHFCLCNTHTPSLPCHFMNTWAPLILRQATEIDFAHIKN